jgi:hypothetical protein
MDDGRHVVVIEDGGAKTQSVQLVCACPRGGAWQTRLPDAVPQRGVRAVQRARARQTLADVVVPAAASPQRVRHRALSRDFDDLPLLSALRRGKKIV